VDKLVLDDLVRLLGPDRVLVDREARTQRRRDEWVRSHLDEAEGVLALPICVVRPKTVTEVRIAVGACIDRACPIVPYGLGSGVCGGVRPGANAVVLDLGDLCAVRAIDANDLTATFEAGVRGSDAEAALAEHGLTLGHAPQSLAKSSVGGWVATRSTGQSSTRFGGIEENVLGLEVVLPDASVLTTNGAPRSSTGPSLIELFLGSEGTLGVITAARLSVRRAPEAIRCTALRPRDVASGLELMREMVQRDMAPPILRLYDKAEVLRHFPSAGDGRALLLLVHEGFLANVELESALCRAVASTRKIEEGDARLAETWRRERFNAPSFAALVADGLTFDTIEVAATWSALANLWARVTRDVSAVPGVFIASAHASHAYRSGASLYFTFAGRAEDARARRTLYDAAWTAAMNACVETGATIAHHHGIGRVRAPWLERELGTAGVSALAAIKRALDPRGLFNPGVLFAEAPS
jgi:alkyldihydroxyacetonephosphate synthase